MTRDDHVKQLRIDINNYDHTAQAIKALANELLWTDGDRKLSDRGAAFIGRRMDTSTENRISPDVQVTPDLVVRISGNWGVVAEAKLAISGDPALREPKLVEIQKYDDDLVGWDTRDTRIGTHDVVLLIRYSHSADVRKHIVQLQETGSIRYERAFALVSFAIVDEAQSWVMLQLVHGKLSNEGKTDKFAGIVKIALNHVAAYPQYADVELYDARPPMPRLMDLIHKEVFGRLDRDQLLQLHEENVTTLIVDVDILRGQLSESVGPGQPGERVPEIPKRKWVKAAMELFANIGWARKLDAPPDSYEYQVRKRRNPFGQFITKYADALSAAEAKKAEKHESQAIGKQMLLFNGGPSDDED